MKLHILGCYAATPRTLSNPTAQILEIRNHLFLIDCGEGTQVELRRNKVKFSRINHIFISHLHGDHFFGLPGLISTFRLLGREKELHIYGPKGIKEAITLLFKLADSWTSYPLIFHELDSKEPLLLFQDAGVEVSTIPLAHRIYTNGFRFTSFYSERKLNIDAVREFGIGKEYFQKIKNGGSVTLEDGRVIPNQELTLDPPEPKHYAYCSDTAYYPDIIPLIRGVDVLYHEATFLESEAGLAKKTKHSTAGEAATIARDAEVGQLILGHFSTRYRNPDSFLEEAQRIFPNTLLAADGKLFEF
ncbi:ribonuclease Z [Poritiphilus flavus]|uniref:Ribonuclease Z n=1 Tax=Poritiphilus flavus TaxID=2697053 RepID=A0A6L9EBF8_9FLAO|nr:ribonuclease Z [Poritiphilus flavus]NAS12086.1 ribonuclease Z [Poritiphilus flavus]